LKTIVLIGDSIRMGYQEEVSQQLAEWATVWGPEENGGTSQNVLAHLDQWALSRPADVVHVNCGLHDIRREHHRDGPTVPLHVYAQNVRSILTRLKAETEAAVVWASTTPVNQEWHNRIKPFDRFARDVETYNAAASEICLELGVPINDLCALVDSTGRDSLLLQDGVHFKPEGYALLGESVAECIRTVTAFVE